MPGVAVEARPYAVIALVCVSLAASLVVSVQGVSSLDVGALVLPGAAQWWRVFTTPFLYIGNVGYEFVALLATAIFGTAIERRFGRVTAIATFVLCGAAGAALAIAAQRAGVFGHSPTAVLGANGAALGLLCAWLVDDRLALRRGDDRENDLLGVYVLAAVLVALSIAEASANIVAALGGAAAGVVLGIGLTTFFKR